MPCAWARPRERTGPTKARARLPPPPIFWPTACAPFCTPHRRNNSSFFFKKKFFWRVGVSPWSTASINSAETHRPHLCRCCKSFFFHIAAKTKTKGKKGGRVGARAVTTKKTSISVVSFYFWRRAGAAVRLALASSQAFCLRGTGTAPPRTRSVPLTGCT